MISRVFSGLMAAVLLASMFAAMLPAVSAQSTNYIVNPGFEVEEPEPVGWTGWWGVLPYEAVQAHSGIYGADIDTARQGGEWYQSRITQELEGLNYDQLSTLTFWVYWDTVEGYTPPEHSLVQLQIESDNGQCFGYYEIPAQNQWVEIDASELLATAFNPPEPLPSPIEGYPGRGYLKLDIGSYFSDGNGNILNDVPGSNDMQCMVYTDDWTLSGAVANPWGSRIYQVQGGGFNFQHTNLLHGDYINRTVTLEVLSGVLNGTEAAFYINYRTATVSFYNWQQCEIEIYTETHENMRLDVSGGTAQHIQAGYSWNVTLPAEQYVSISWVISDSVIYEENIMFWIGLAGIGLFAGGIGLGVYALRTYKIFTLKDEDTVFDKEVLPAAIVMALIGISLIFAWFFGGA